MPLSREFRHTVKDRADADPAFRAALVEEAVQALVQGDLETGRAALRTCVNATIGFHRLSETTGLPAKSLMRMLGDSGNPSAENLLSILAALQQAAGVKLEVRASV